MYWQNESQSNFSVWVFNHTLYKNVIITVSTQRNLIIKNLENTLFSLSMIGNSDCFPVTAKRQCNKCWTFNSKVFFKNSSRIWRPVCGVALRMLLRWDEKWGKTLHTHKHRPKRGNWPQQGLVSVEADNGVKNTVMTPAPGEGGQGGWGFQRRSPEWWRTLRSGHVHAAGGDTRVC